MRPTATTTVLEALRAFADDVKRSAQSAATANAQPEEQLKRPVTNLVIAVGKALRMDIRVSPEARMEGIGRPDLAILKGDLLIGYVELKAPDVTIDYAWT